MSDSRIAQQTYNPQFYGGTHGSYQVPEVYDPQRLAAGELVKAITLGQGAEISAGNRDTFAYELNPMGLKGWHEGEVVFDLNNQGLTLTGDINARSGMFSGEISIGRDDSIFTATHEGIALGSQIFDRAPFRVTTVGRLYASDAVISGALEGELKTSVGKTTGTSFIVNDNAIKMVKNSNGTQLMKIIGGAGFFGDYSTIVLGPPSTTHVSLNNNRITFSSDVGAGTDFFSFFVSPGASISSYQEVAGDNKVNIKISSGRSGGSPSTNTEAYFGTAVTSLWYREGQNGPGDRGLKIDANGIYIGIGQDAFTQQKVGFLGATPIAKRVVNTAAVDLATVIALTNQIRSWGQDIGFLQ